MKLEIITAAGKSEFVPRPDLGIITVGRQPGNDISLPDEKGASRKHLTIERTADGWKLIDQMSANGTEINGEKVNYAYLKEGDRIQIGATTLLVGGLAPAKPAPAVSGAGRQAVKPVKLPGKSTEAGEPTFAAPAPVSKFPTGLVVAGVVVMFVCVLLYGAFSSGLFDKAPEQAKKQPQVAAKQAELSEADAKLLADARQAAAKPGTVLERLAALDEIAAALPAQRGSVVNTRIDELRADLLRNLDSELSRLVKNELAAVEAFRESGDLAGAVNKTDELLALFAANKYAATRGKTLKLDDKVAEVRKELGLENDRYISGKLTQADNLVKAGRFDEAIAVVGQILSGAWLTEEDRILYEKKSAEIKTLRDKPQAAPTVSKPGEDPDIIKGIKKEERGTLPGKNPLLPNGADSEKALITALQRKFVRAAVEKKLTSVEFTWKGDRAKITGADNDRLFFTVSKMMKDENGRLEEIPVGRKEKWNAFAPTDMLQLFDRTPLLTKEDRLAEVIYALDNGLTDEGSGRALALFKEDPTLKSGIDILLASKRHIRVPDGGFVEYDGRFVTPDEKENGVFERKLSDVLERFQKGLGSKDRKRIEDSEKAYQELLAMGERAVAPTIKILDTLRIKEKAKAESATGLVTKDSAKLKDLKAELDKRRKYALELIMDEVKYPYPYFTEEGKQAEVQAEVDKRVAAVREIWDDPMSFAGQTSPEFEASIERLTAINVRMDELDKEEKFHKSTAEADIAYLKHIGNTKLDIRNYAGDDAGVKVLLPLNAEIMAYNEAFPTGEGHTDAEGREQVKITNEYRMMFERRALKINDKLFWAAKHHSRYCVEHNGGQIAHVIEGEPKGAAPGDRMKYEGYAGGGGENIHMNSRGPTALSSHQSWCHSSGHHRNILTPGWKVLGSGKFGNIWTQNFGAMDEGDKNSESKGGQD
ncbi:MAG: FHA domain-containing protein [Planctomycetes bacterium]|nr:FHA domain-containing protein [Planctomycetota bacterium]